MMPFLRCLFILAVCFIPRWAAAQLAEVKPFDTAQNARASAGRVFSEGVKENILGNSDEAGKLFLKFTQAQPNEAAGWFELAKISLKKSDKVKAEQYVKKAMALDSGSKWYKEFYANILATNEKYAEAAELFRRLANQYRPNDEYLLKASLLYRQAKKLPQAVAVLEQIMEESGPDEEILVQISKLYAESGKPDSAAEALRRLIAADPNEGRYRALLAEHFVNNKQYAQAKQVLTEAEAKMPKDISVQLGFASLYRKMKDTAQYLEYVNKTIANPTIDEQTQVTLFVSYLQEGERDSAGRRNSLVLAERLLAQRPSSAALHSIYGDLLAQNNRLPEAIAAYKKSLSIDSANFNTWQQFLLQLTNKPEADSLIKYGNQALLLYPTSSFLHYLTAIGYVNKGDWNKAEEATKQAIDFQSDDNPALLAEMNATLGDIYQNKKDFANADKSFEEALRLQPENATVLNNFAYYLATRKVRLDDAERYSLQSLKIRPGEPTFLDTYGWILYRQGKLDKARAAIEEAIAKSGADADATLHDHLGDILFKLKLTEQAVKEWEIAFTKEPDNKVLESKIKNKRLDE